MKWGREYCGMKRSIKKPMGELWFHFVGIFLAVFCLFFAGFCEGNRRISEEVSSGNGGHWTHQETDENTAEQMWIYCKKELGEIAKTINGFNLYSDNNPKRDVASSRKTLVHNPLTDLPPQLKRSLLLSLKSKRYRSHVSDTDGCQECLSILYGRNIHPRKTNRRRHHHHQRRRSLKEPSPVPTESSHKRLSQKPAIQGELLPKKKPPDHVLLIGIIVSTSMATLALFFLLLICCVGGNDNKIAAMSAQEDEKTVINKYPGGISDCSQMPEAVEGKKDSINSCNKNNLSPKAACQTPEIGNLPLPPGKTAPPPPAPPPPPPAAPKAPPPPPPPIGPRPPDPPKLGNMKRPPGPPPRVGLHNSGRSNSGDEKDRSDSLKTKLKPFFWDKMNASPNQSMVWHGIKEGSFQFDEEMMESLFGYANGQSKGNRGKSTSNLNPRSKFIQIIDPRKAQNLAILLKALNVTTERVCNALKEGNELPVVLISTLIKMAPTQEEELKLRLYNGDLELLGPAERFLKVVVEIPFVFKRFEALLFMSALQEESSSLKDAFATLEVACSKLKNSRLFLKLLEAVLKTGNRMNVGTHRGGAQAIKLDSLLKLSDVKGTDGKTTLLSFVVQEIIRSEGVKAARARRPSGSLSTVNTDDLQEEPIERSPEYYRKLGLEVVSRLNDELEDVKKAAVVDGDNITSTVLKLGTMFKKTKDVIDNELSSEATEFCNALHGFMEHAEAEIVWMLEEENRIMTLVKSTGDYFHGNSGKDNEGLRLFAIVRDFLKLLDRVCIDIKKTAEMNSKKKDETPGGKTKPSGKENDGRSSQSVHEKLFPAIKDRQMDYSSSDDEDTSP